MTHQGFDRHFWHYIGPSLSRLCVAEARCVAAGVQSYGDALGVLLRYALRHGGGHLSATRWYAFEDDMAERLVQAIAEAEAAGWGEWLERNHISVPLEEPEAPAPELFGGAV